MTDWKQFLTKQIFNFIAGKSPSERWGMKGDIA